MTRRKRRSKAEWRELVEQQQRGGLSGLAFCDKLGLSRKTFYQQRKSLVQTAADSEAGQFIKINPGPVQVKPLQAAVVLHYRNSQLQLPADANPTWVAELLKALA